MIKLIYQLKAKIEKYYNDRFFKKNNLQKLNNIKTHLTESEKRVLYSLAKKKSDGFIVEIGSFVGASCVFIASSIKEGKILCIDTWENDAMSEGKKNTWDEFCLNTYEFEQKIIKIKGFSNEVVEKVRKIAPQIDMLFIDGDHSYEGCKMDFDLYFPLIKKSGIIIFHDSGWANGVKKVIKEDVLKLTYNHSQLPNMFYAWKK